MAAALCYPSLEGSLPAKAEEQGRGVKSTLAQSASGVHPIHFLYGHLHNSIRTELDNLSNWVLALEADNEEDLQQRLQHLKERYHFLEQVYKYHSSVEDEVRGLFMSCEALQSLLLPCSSTNKYLTCATAVAVWTGCVPCTRLQGQKRDFRLQRGASG